MAAKLEVDVVAQLKEFNKKMSELKDNVDDVGTSIEKNNQRNSKSTGRLTSAFSSLGAAVAGAFAVDQIISFGKQVLATTVEFENMEAVLKTTLGSKSAAQTAMRQITEFAAATPYQVNDLTGAFIKLANRGLIPTMQQMTQMGDLAAATGKSFDQLVEAILDAQTGEFERLKEFGVRAKSEGDKVIFTFKGVETQVKNNTEAITEHLISLGAMNGVMGGMAEMAKTTGGALSNLQENYTGLMNDIGKLTKPAMDVFITSISQAITILRNFPQYLEGLKFWEDFADKSDAFKNYMLDLDSATTKAGTSLKAFTATFDKIPIQDILGNKGYQKEFLDFLVSEGQTLKDSQALWDTYIQRRKKAFDEQRKLSGIQKENNKITKESTEVTSAFTAEMKAIYDEANRRALELMSEDAERYQADMAALVAIKKRAVDLNAKFNKGGVSILPPPISAEDLELLKQADLVVENFKKNMQLNTSIAATFGGVMGDVFTDLMNGGKNAVQVVIQALKRMIAQFMAAIAAAVVFNILTGGIGNAFKGGIKGLLSTGKGMGLTPFANGGIVSGPTPALVGEYTGARNNPEVIAPLSKLQNMMGGNVTFTISGDNLVGTLNRANKTRGRKF